MRMMHGKLKKNELLVLKTLTGLSGNEPEIKKTLVLLRCGITSTMENRRTKRKYIDGMSPVDA